MWTRAELKTRAKDNLRTKYWTAFAVALITGILSGRSSGSFNFSFNSSDWQNWQNGGIEDLIDPMVILAMIPLIILVSLIGLAFMIFVGNPVQVGGCRWFSRSREAVATPSVGMMFSLFRNGSYLSTVGSMLWMNLFLFIWGLLSLIPLAFGAAWLAADSSLMAALEHLVAGDGNGLSFWLNQVENQTTLSYLGLIQLAAVLLSIPAIIKGYSYAMTPWILADNPAIGFRRALRLSIDMTRGHKWAMFVLNLSFIGWLLLGFLACCVGVVFVEPYIVATQAELYARLRQNAVSSGLCTMEELGFIPVAPTPAF